MAPLVEASLRMLLAVGGLAVAAWLYLRWRKTSIGSGRRLEVLDRVPVGRNAALALVAVDGRRLLVGVSQDGVRLVRDLSEPDGSFDAALAAEERS